MEDFNIGTTNDPKYIKISKNLPEKARMEYLALSKKYTKVFSWRYEDLKVYDTSIIQHTIPIKEDAKTFKQKLRRINPLLLPLIEREVKKLFQAKIIVALRNSRWLANVVPVRKKNEEIRICIDFKNLNRVSLKDNYPLPKMDHILQKVVGSQRMSMLDGFSGYNQVLVHPDDQEKIAFTTPWGTFMYSKMPFGLMNVGATFQRAMDIAFSEEKDKFVVIYLDDIIVYSKIDEKHLQHLERVFLKCLKFGVSLNPKKSHFALEEGKILGHIISKDGIRIDPARVEAIGQIALPRNKKEVQSFIGKVNFLRRFIIDCAEKMRTIIDMLRKGSEIKRNPEAKKSFEDIKDALMKAPILISPDFQKDFLIYSFASKHTVAGVLLKKNEEGYEQPISFFSKTLRDPPLKYNILEKQSFALIKALKDFRVYIIHSHIVAYVPSVAVKDILTQPDPEGRRAKWTIVLLEYDLEIKHTKIIKAQGLAKLMTEAGVEDIDINFLDICDISDQTHQEPEISEDFLASPWYRDIIYVIKNLQAPPELTDTKARLAKLKSSR